jgi:hypothetical protein
MTPLRQRMIDDMQLRNLAPATQRNYIYHVARFASYYGLSPEKLDLEDIRQFHLYLLNDRKYSPEAVNQSVSAVKFLYTVTLEMPWSDEHFPRARRQHKLPIVLSPEEVVQFFDHVPSLRYRAALMTCYGAGLRVSEAVALKLSDIDSKRMRITVCFGVSLSGGLAACCSASNKAKDARTATPCFHPGCWKCCASGSVPPVPSTGYSPVGAPAGISLPLLCRLPAAMPACVRTLPRGSPSTRCGTVLQPTCWRTAPTSA